MSKVIFKNQLAHGGPRELKTSGLGYNPELPPQTTAYRQKTKIYKIPQKVPSVRMMFIQWANGNRVEDIECIITYCITLELSSQNKIQYKI